MKKILTLTAIAFIFAGCNSPTAKSVEFYKTHQEAREQMKEICVKKSEQELNNDQDCVNLRQALSELSNTKYTAPTSPQKNVDDYIKTK